jgi:hypothetical protein
MRVDFSFITREAFAIAWRHKLLWIFGIFVGGTTWNGNVGGDISPEDIGITEGDLSGLFDVPEAFWVGAGIAIAFFVLAMLIAGIISTGGLIDALNRIVRGNGQWSFGQSFSRALDFFFPLLGMLLAVIVGAMGYLVAAVLIGVGMFHIHVAAGILYIMVALPLSVLVYWAGLTSYALAERALIVRGQGFVEAWSEGWALFKRFWKESAVMALLKIGIGIAIAMATTVIMLIFGGPAFLTAIAGGIEFTVSMLVAVLITWPVLLVVGGFTGAATFNLYTLFYFELVEPRQQQAIQRHEQPPAPSA